MNFKAYITPLIKYWWLILGAALIAGVSSFLVTRSQPPTYQTTTTLIVGRATFEANPTSNDLWLGQQLANYYSDIGTRGEVRNSTMEALGLTRLPSYTIQPLPNSQLLEIVVVDTNPRRAQAVANELANQLIVRSPTSNQQMGSERQAFINEQVTYLETKIRETLDEITKAEKELTEMNSARQIADAQTQISALQTKLNQLQNNYAALIANTDQGATNTLSVIERAPLPTEPVGPKNSLTIALAALVAAAVAAMAGYLLEFLDDTVKSADEVYDLTGSMVLGNIPLISKDDEIIDLKPVTPMQALNRRLSGLLPAKKKKSGKDEKEQGEDIYIYAANNPRSIVAEEFRSLRVNLDFFGVDKPLKTILVTSADPKEGKTSVATNLAIVMSQAGKKVILVDADFRKPSVDEHFQISNHRGLSDVFRENLDLYEVVQHWRENVLWIITTGSMPPNPVDLLSSQKMNQILMELEKMADVVIIDGPPLMFPDSLALSTKVDGVLLVLRHSYSRRGPTVSHHKQLTQVGARIIGAVLNRVPAKHAAYYKSYRYYQRSQPEAKADPEPKRVS